jgi:hypothetical protein
MPLKEKRQRQEKGREIMECVKQNFLKAFHTPKKENSYQLKTGNMRGLN